MFFIPPFQFTWISLLIRLLPNIHLISSISVKMMNDRPSSDALAFLMSCNNSPQATYGIDTLLRNSALADGGAPQQSSAPNGCADQTIWWVFFSFVCISKMSLCDRVPKSAGPQVWQPGFDSWVAASGIGNESVQLGFLVLFCGLWVRVRPRPILAPFVIFSKYAVLKGVMAKQEFKGNSCLL